MKAWTMSLISGSVMCSFTIQLAVSYSLCGVPIFTTLNVFPRTTMYTDNSLWKSTKFFLANYSDQLCTFKLNFFYFISGPMNNLLCMYIAPFHNSLKHKLGRFKSKVKAFSSLLQCSLAITCTNYNLLLVAFILSPNLYISSLPTRRLFSSVKLHHHPVFFLLFLLVKSFFVQFPCFFFPAFHMENENGFRFSL